MRKSLKNGVPLELKMYPSSSDFVLMSETKDCYSMNIVNCTLRVCFVELNPKILEPHDKVTAENQVDYYPLTMMDTKTFSIPAGLTSYSFENPWLNLEPLNIYVAFIEAENFYGKVESNLFELQHMNLQRLELKWIE